MAMAATTSSFPPRFGAMSMMRHEHLSNPSNSHIRFKRSRGKRVSWASNDQLCQVRMFLAEDAPFLAGIAQEQLQVKTTSFMHSAEDLPPGFGGGFGVAPVAAAPAPVGGAVSSCMKVDTEALVASVVPAISWRCPLKLELDPQWLVEAGEASSEVECQKRRESTTLEAVYPRSSAIPTSPAEPEDQGVFVDDRQVLLIPVVAADEDSDGEENSGQGGTSVSTAVNVLYGGYNNQAVMKETSVANKAMYMNPADGVNNANGNNGGIDTRLLFQLLANPSLVETLSGLRNNSMVNTPNGNGANHLLVPPRNQSVTGSSQPAVVRNLNSLTPFSSTTTTTSSATQTVAPPLPASIGFPAPVAPLAWQQQQQQQQQPLQQSGPPGFQHQYLNMNMNLNSNSSSSSQQQQQQGSRHGEQYFKELIMQHGRGGSVGGNGQQVQQQQQVVVGGGAGAGGNGYVSNGYPPGFGLLGETASKPRGLLSETTSSKPRRVCAYFNTAKGCRNGSKCPFLHDGKRNGSELNHIPAQQHHKRMRS